MELYGVIFDENNLEDVLNIVSRHKSCVKENVFKKYFPNLYEKICMFSFPESFTFAQKLFHYLHKDFELSLGKCKVCGNPVSFLGFTRGYRKYCGSACMGKDPDFWDEHKTTNMARYGCEFSAQSDIIKDKIKSTNKEKYGCEYIFQFEGVKDKIKETNIKRYGKEFYNNPSKIKQTWKEKSSEEINNIVEQRELIYKEKTGYSNPFSNPDVKTKIRETNKKKYGTPVASQSDDVKSKISQTKAMFSKEHNEDINNKRRSTCRDLYGTDSVMKLDDVKEKSSETRRQNTLKKYPGVMSISNNSIFKCTCPNPDCNECEEKCFYISRSLYNHRTQSGEELCTNKNVINYSSSNEEKEFRNFIQSIYRGTIEFNERKILDGKEIDIYLPELKIGFEFNGIYWHSELYRDKYYHQKKVLDAKNKGIQLIQIWEDDWFYKRDIVENYIKGKLGLFEYRIGARECEIKEVNNQISKEFIDKYHLQGYVNSSIRIGLYYNDELISIITFGKKRKIMNSKSNDGEYELYRFCSKPGYTIIGGFKKMLSYFIKNFSPKKINTYASLDISYGEIYLKSGFSFVKVTEPGYCWANESKENKLIYNHRKHRFNFTKGELVKLGYDKNLSEDEIMHQRNYIKCYDSGNILFEFINHKYNS